MRKEFTIKLTLQGKDKDEQAQEKSFTVTDTIAARNIFEPRVGNTPSIILKNQPTKFLQIPLVDLTCIAYGLIKGSGHEITEDEVGQAFVDMGDVGALQQILPIIDYWIDKMNTSLGVNTGKKQSSTSRAKRTSSR
jgi:hypothetical protein